jgi:tight adherence protein C
MALELILPATFIAATCVVYFVVRAVCRDDREAVSRLRSLSTAGDEAVSLRRGAGKSLFGQLVQQSLPGLATRLLPESEKNQRRLQSRLMHAGIYAPPALGIYLSVKICLITVPPIACFIAGQLGAIEPRMAVLYGAASAGLGMLLPSIWLEKRKARRHAMLNRSLPDFLDLMVACMESGLSLNAALQRVTDELQTAHPVLAGELAAVQRQVQLGATLDAAMSNFAERSDLDTLYSLTTMIQQSQKFGASIADALRIHADVLRSEREQNAEELAQKAAVKILFPTLLLIFPATFVVLAGPAVIQLNEKFSSASETKRVK